MPIMPPFTATFKMTTDDLVDYLRLAQKALNNIGMLAGAVGALYGIFLAYQGDAAVGAVLVGMAIFLFLVSATRYADRLRASSLGKRVVGTQASYTIDEGGIDSHTVAGKAHVSWSAATNLLESPTMVVLRRGRTTILWLPKRAMGSPAERDALLAFIREHVTPPAPEAKAAKRR